MDKNNSFIFGIRPELFEDEVLHCISIRWDGEKLTASRDGEVVSPDMFLSE